jgi:hypothetical protein
MQTICIGVTDYIRLYIVGLIYFFALDLLSTRYHYSNLCSSLLLEVIA